MKAIDLPAKIVIFDSMKHFIRFRNSICITLLIGIVIACSTLPERIPSSDEDFSFVVVGDMQQGLGIFSQLAIRIGNLEPAPSATFFLGDYMAESGLEIEWLNFWNYAEPITAKMPVFLARGNHEGNTQEDNYALRQYGKFPSGPFYRSIRIEEITFLILDTHEEGEGNTLSDEQKMWLTNELNTATADSSIRTIFIGMHHPLYPQGFHKGNGLLNSEEIHGLFTQHPKIRIVFSGHDHLYNRFIKDNINYIISGGGGAYLHHGFGGDYHHFVKVSIYRQENRINIKTIGIFNEIVEDFDI